LKYLKGNQTCNQGCGTGQLPSTTETLHEDVLCVRDFRKCFLNYDATEMRHK